MLRKCFGGFVALLLTTMSGTFMIWLLILANRFLGRSDLMDYIVTANILLLRLHRYFVAADQRERAYEFANRRCPQMLDV
jgi:hypothetical protein